MKNSWFSFLFRNDDQETFEIPSGKNYSFVLRYKQLEIGVLNYEQGIWSFQYTDAFRFQDKVQPLINFPDTAKIYQSDTLWPFFLHRIPGQGQPRVQTIIQKEGLDPKDAGALLKRFGEWSITNPFQLIVPAR